MRMKQVNNNNKKGSSTAIEQLQNSYSKDKDNSYKRDEGSHRDDKKGYNSKMITRTIGTIKRIKRRIKVVKAMGMKGQEQQQQWLRWCDGSQLDGYNDNHTHRLMTMAITMTIMWQQTTATNNNNNNNNDDEEIRQKIKHRSIIQLQGKGMTDNNKDSHWKGGCGCG